MAQPTAGLVKKVAKEAPNSENTCRTLLVSRRSRSSSGEGRVLWATREEVAKMQQVPDLKETIDAYDDPTCSELYYRDDGTQFVIELL